jgi:hypothetical protein
MASLDAIMKERYDLFNKIVESDGEIDEVTELFLENNEKELKQKLEAYIFVINKLQSDINTNKDHIEMLKFSNEALEEKIEFLRKKLAYFAENNGGSLETGSFKITPKEYVKKVINPSLLEESDKKFKVTVGKLSPNELTEIENYIQIELGKEFSFNLDVNLSDLPEDHPAITKEVKYLAQIRAKARPKKKEKINVNSN